MLLHPIAPLLSMLPRCTGCEAVSLFRYAHTSSPWVRAAKSSGDAAHAERFGIFIGLWAPTFFALADAVGTQEVAE